MAGAPRGDDVEVELELDLVEAVFGVSRDVEIRTDVPCETCDGSGAKPGTGRETCPQCQGSGRVREVSSLGGFGQFIRTSTCNVCRGQGTIVREPCQACRGTGRRRAPRTVKVDVPAGIDDGQRLRLTGEGGAGGPARAPATSTPWSGCGPTAASRATATISSTGSTSPWSTLPWAARRTCRRSTAT